jgi:hypothetical protein
MRIRSGLLYISAAVLGSMASISTSLVAAPTTPRIAGYVDNTYTFGFSGAFNHSDTEFKGFGSASDTTGLICADGTMNLWNSGMRYSGEFAGLRIAAAGSLCQGFGTASEPVAGFDGKTTLGSFMSGGARLIAPINMNAMMIMPSVGAGIGFGNVKVQAAPFESDRSWRSGFYWEVGVAIPFSNWNPSRSTSAGPVWGTGSVQGIDAAATELYLNFKRWDAGNQTLDGGAQTRTNFDMYVVGVRTKW